MTSINTKYLGDLCQTCSKNKVELRPSPLGGLGVFAKIPIIKGDVVMAIPRDIILSSSAPDVLSDSRVAKLAADERITAETLLCAFVVWNKMDSSSKHHAYLTSLPPDYTQLNPSELEGTNVGAQLQADAQELASQHKIVQEIIPDSKLSLEDFSSARVLYNSRRFPLRFAPRVECINVSGHGGDDAAIHGEGGKKSKTTMPELDGQPNKKTRISSRPRAVYDPTQGSMCPALDVLNHQSGRDLDRRRPLPLWNRLRPSSGRLHPVPHWEHQRPQCQHPRRDG